MAIAEARAETSEQTGVKRKPGTVMGKGMMGWGRRCRCRRGCMLMRRRTVNVQSGQVDGQDSPGPALEDPEIAIAPPRG